MNIERHFPLVEEILGAYHDALGADFRAYRNHVYRVANLCCSVAAFGAEDRTKIQIAACFHDIGIWTDATLDYLSPSEAEAAKYLGARGKEAWIPEVARMIEMHHRVRPCADSAYPLVEPFRRADIADFSLGLFGMGLSRALISALKSEFPNAGFHGRLLQLGGGWVLRHPLRPLPMFRW